MSSAEDCGMEIWSEDRKSGFIETTHYYIKEGEERLRCNWEISTNCDKIEWMFDKFDFNDKTGSYYDSIFEAEVESIEENVEKVFNCLSDNVQVSFGQKSTKKFCNMDQDSMDYDDEDFNKLYDDPTGTAVMTGWSTISGSDFQIDYQTKHLIYGFKINWRCLEQDQRDADKL